MACRLEIALHPASTAGAPLLLDCYRQALAEPSFGPAPDRLWVVRDSHQSTDLLHKTAATRHATLSPGVKPLAQAVDWIVASAPGFARPIRPVQRAVLIEDLLASARANRFPLLSQAAGTPGGIDFVAAALTQLAHTGQTPSELLDKAEELRDKRSIELARAYEDYTKALNTHNLIDNDARLRLACELCERDVAPRRPLRLLAISGVDSPTRLELRLLTALLSRSEQGMAALAIDQDTLDTTLPDDDLPSPSLGPLAVLNHWRKTFPELTTTQHDHSFDDSDPRRYALDRLFGDPRDTRQGVAPAPSGRLSVHSATGAQQEVADAARRAKQLLLDGAKPEDIVVATRHTNRFAPRLREAFQELGVPLAVEGALPLAASPLARASALLLRLATGNWRHTDLLSVVTLPALRCFDAPIDDENQWAICRRLGFAGRRAATEWILRELLYPQGRKELLNRITWLSENWLQNSKPQGDEGPSLDRHRDRVAAAAVLATPGLVRLGELGESLATAATPLAWWDRLADLLRALDYRSPQELRAEDDAARTALEEAFGSVACLRSWQGRAAPELELPDVETLVNRWLSRARLDLPWRHEGHVRALSAESAAGLSHKHLLLIGLDEQSFPRADTAVALAGDAARERRHQSDEMLLFCRLIGTASESTTLSFTGLDDKAQPLNPSSYVAELERLFATGSLRKITAEPQAASPLCESDLRKDAVRRLMANEPSAASEALNLPGLATGLRASHERSHGQHFGKYEGVLEGAAAIELADARYGPKHMWSASQLELYATCPFKFYLRHMLRAEPLESLALDVDYRRRGSLLHDAMVRFHQRVNEQLKANEAASSLDPEEFLAAFQEAITLACQAIAAAPHEQAVAEVEALQAAAWADPYRRQHEKYDQQSADFDQPLRPTHFEARFGPAVSSCDEPEDPLSTDDPFALKAGDQTVLLTGKVDRIDVGRVDGQLVFSVVDYKTAKSMTIKQEDIESGRLLQLVLYTIAVSDHLLADQNALPWQSGYWLIQKEGFKTGKLPQPGERVEGQVLLGKKWRDLADSVRAKVGDIVHDVRAARFPMSNPDEDCGGRCEYRTVCRVAQARSLGKSPKGDEA